VGLAVEPRGKAGQRHEGRRAERRERAREEQAGSAVWASTGSVTCMCRNQVSRTWSTSMNSITSPRRASIAISLVRTAAPLLVVLTAAALAVQSRHPPFATPSCPPERSYLGVQAMRLAGYRLPNCHANDIKLCKPTASGSTICRLRAASVRSVRLQAANVWPASRAGCRPPFTRWEPACPCGRRGSPPARLWPAAPAASAPCR